MNKGTIVHGGDILSYNGSLYAIENRVPAKYAEIWLINHGFQMVETITASIGRYVRKFNLYQKQNRPNVAVPVPIN